MGEIHHIITDDEARSAVTLIGDYYEAMYNGELEESYEFVVEGEKLLDERNESVRKIAEFRGDWMTSDREIAALWLAWRALGIQTEA